MKMSRSIHGEDPILLMTRSITIILEQYCSALKSVMDENLRLRNAVRFWREMKSVARNTKDQFSQTPTTDALAIQDTIPTENPNCKKRKTTNES